jgi:tetratricopeptide (TPR) repeat protein
MRERLAPKEGRRDEGRGECRRSRAAEALRTLYAERKNAARYQEICELTGLTTEDCKVLAEIHTKRRKPEEALAWVERGISMLDDPEWDIHGLYDLQRQLLFRLGRKDEALESAWQRFESYPCDTWYDGLMKYVPRAKRAEWHRRAMDAAAQGSLGNLIQLCLKTKEVELLVQKVREASHEDLEEISHHTTEPAAKRLAKTHPDLAAKLYRAQGMRIVTAKKSKYYDAAHGNFEQAKKHYARAGLHEEWEALVELVREEHSRKSSFMPGFERVVAGETAAGPSFAERTRRQWERRGRR